MPRISEFYGIAVYIYYRDHNQPHFHAIYGDSEAIVEIRTGEILEGRLPRRVTKLVAEWCEAPPRCTACRLGSRGGTAASTSN